MIALYEGSVIAVKVAPRTGAARAANSAAT
jgi:hypothetical protein